MKVVIADTSPLNYLILVGAVDILPRLYGRVMIPDLVLRELTGEGAPKEVAEWAAIRPECRTPGKGRAGGQLLRSGGSLMGSSAGNQ